MTIPINKTELTVSGLADFLKTPVDIKNKSQLFAMKLMISWIDKEIEKIAKEWKEVEPYYTIEDIEKTDFESIAEFTTDTEFKMKFLLEKVEYTQDEAEKEIEKLLSNILDNLSKIDWITGDLYSKLIQHRRAS